VVLTTTEAWNHNRRGIYRLRTFKRIC